MDDYLSDEQIEYAVTSLIQLVEFRKLSTPVRKYSDVL